MKKSQFVYLMLGLCALVAAYNLDVNLFSFVAGIPNLFQLAGDAIPPESSIIVIGIVAILETLQIAFLGTLIGLVLALPCALCASRNISPSYLVIPSRILLAALRTMPSLLWAIVFVIMVGFGPFAGVLATIMYSVGYIGKLQYESIEGMSREPLEAIGSIGASKLQLIRFVVLPESANNLLSQALFMFEYNVRASSILGFVGAGGIGFYISSYVRFLEYDKVLTLLMVTLAAVLIIDFCSAYVRDRFLKDSSRVV